MDKNLKAIFQKKIEKTLESLKKNNMQAYYLETKAEVVGKVQELMSEGSTVTVGGSMSLFETGVIDHLKSGRYQYFDRYKEGLSREEMREIFIKAFTCDTYLTSSNAITESGELYNVDGNSNRVAAMLFGPKSVIVIAGYNKLVRDHEEAVARVENISAPANCVRLNCPNPCVQTGHCMDCKLETRICCNYVSMGVQKHPGRIKVIIVGEELGY